jgi:hypothetical protein
MDVFYAAAIVVVLLWVGVRITLPSVNFEFDFDQNHGTFFLLMEKYLWTVRGMVAVDLVLAYLRPHTQASQVCLCGGIAGILFCVWLLVCYEGYLGARYPRNNGPSKSNYTPGKYATTLALGRCRLSVSPSD